jgi:branched-chain amino acid transport system substrate-binding protein
MPSDGDIWFEQVSRLRFLRRTGAAALGFSVAPAVARAAARISAVPTATPPPAVVKQIVKLIGPIDRAYSGKGLTLPVGAMLALSGPAADVGVSMLPAANMAIEQIAAAGGPRFKLIAKDDHSANPTFGAQISLALGEAKVPMSLTIDRANGQGAIANIAKYHILALEAGAGLGPGVFSLPYLWGSRMNQPYDAIPGIAKYIAATMKSNAKIAFVQSGGGSAQVTASDQAAFQSSFKAAGRTIATFIQGPPFGSTDFSGLITNIRSVNPDVMVATLYGPDVGLFMKQYVPSGLTIPIIGVDFSPDSIAVGGSAVNGFKFSEDFFSSETATNPWGQLFIKEYDRKYGAKPFFPNFWHANAYEDIFIFWELVRRVLKAKGNPRSGAALQKALLANPTFPSVYGTGAKTGSLVFDRTSHALAHRPMALVEVVNGKPKVRATYDKTGAGFKLTK